MRSPTINDIPPAARTEVERRLDEIERRNDVRIILAVESGSRAWGFASPDSDFDGRFIYVRPVRWYLSLEEGRDVVETPIEGDMDLNGWDIRKALRLARSFNPVLVEWLLSPIIYRQTADADLVRAYVLANRGRRAMVRHYLGLLRGAWARHGARAEVERVRLKPYFYGIRPAVALAWLEQRQDVPPMTLPALLDGIVLDDDVRDEIATLRQLKSHTTEIGEGPRMPGAERLLLDRLAWGQSAFASMAPDDRVDAGAADALFQRLIGAR